jgi:hypothetical protein
MVMFGGYTSWRKVTWKFRVQMECKMYHRELIVKEQHRFNSLILQLFEVAKVLFTEYEFLAQCIYHSY